MIWISVLLFYCLGIKVNAAGFKHTGTFHNLTFTFDETGTLVISGQGEMPNPEKNDINILANSDMYVSVLDNTFHRSGEIKKIIIEEGITDIKSYAFHDYYNLETIEIPSTVSNIESSSFRTCYSLYSINVNESNKTYSSINGVLFSKDKKTIVSYPNNRDGKEYIIPEGTEIIGESAFRSNENLQNIIIPEGIKIIKTLAFAYTKQLVRLEFPSTLQTIGRDACCESQNLGSVIFSKFCGSVTLGRDVFINCKNLQYVFLPKQLKFLESDYHKLFSGCSKLLSVGEENTGCNIEFQTGITDIGLIFKYSLINTIKIPESVNELKKYSLSESSVETIYIPKSIKKIGEKSFYRCNLLKEIYYSGSENQWEAISGIDDACIPEDVTIHFNDENEGGGGSGSGGNEDTYTVTYNANGGTGTPASQVIKKDENFTISSTKPLRNGYTFLGWGKTANATSVYQPGMNIALTGDTTLYAIWQIIKTSYTGPFTFSSMDKDQTYNMVVYTDDFFDKISIIYNHQLARASLSLAMSAYNSPGGKYLSKDESEVTYDDIMKSKARNVVALLGNFGFDKNTIYVNNDYLKKPQSNTIGVAIAQKRLGDETLIAIAVRGGGYESEWAGNFNVYNSGTHHKGFQIASEKVNTALKKYITQNYIKGNVKFWITGYSRGAAVANLTAAYINNSIGTIPNVSYRQEDVYAYTFEAPRNTKDKQCRSSAKYGNIKNIINPIDPVPMVAMEKWGYERYGFDYHIPCEKTTSNYGRLTVEACNYYDAIMGTIHVYLPHVAGQSYLLQSIIDDIALFAKNDSSARTQKYSTTLQNIMLSMYKEKSSIPVGDILKNVIMEYLKENTQSANKEKKIIKWMFGEMAQSHYAELTLAWMWTLNQDTLEAYNGRPYFRLIKVNCPVDVSVYDGNNSLVAKIKGDVPQKIDGSTIESFIDLDDQKIVILPTDEEYKVKLEATDNGTMTYSVCDMNISTGKTEHIRNYYDLELEKGKSYTDVIPEGSSSNKTTDVMENNEGTTVVPSEEMSGVDVCNYGYNVIVSSKGNGTVSGSCYKKKGDYALVSATPANGEEFLGWYIGDKKVSTSQEYRICVKDDISLTGVFSTNTSKAQETTKKTVSKKTKKKPVTKITISGISQKIVRGKEIQLTAKVLPAKASNKKLKWTSNNEKIATVTQTGIVKINKKAKAKKKVTITATATDGSNKKASYMIVVMKGAVKKITVKGAKKKLKVGKTMKLKAVVKTTKGKPVNKKLKWISSNPDYATVTQTGKVKALKDGKGKIVKIKVISTDGTNKNVTKKIKIK